MGSKRSLFATFIIIFVVIGLTACSQTSTKSPDVTDNIRKSLDQAGLKDVNVSQDRDKGVVTLSGKVASNSEKMQAESIARSNAGSQVVANEIAVEPRGDESTAKKGESDLDSAIDKEFHAELVEHKLQRDVRYDVKNGVITLKGKVNSPGRRNFVEQMAKNVPDVREVVNELEVRNQKATSSD